MGKWTKAAKEIKKHWDEREAKATDMELLIDKIMQLPHGQLKKVLTDDIVAILEKYGVSLDE